jgi:hypothetical protein
MTAFYLETDDSLASLRPESNKLHLQSAGRFRTLPLSFNSLPDKSQRNGKGLLFDFKPVGFRVFEMPGQHGHNQLNLPRLSEAA